ncbi:hypothetical protein SNEBB_003235 [Seison nebaliae]|nr:hypothetical protein SNEBB_003235 [Seison nebaliae]
MKLVIFDCNDKPNYDCSRYLVENRCSEEGFKVNANTFLVEVCQKTCDKCQLVCEDSPNTNCASIRQYCPQLNLYTPTRCCKTCDGYKFISKQFDSQKTTVISKDHPMQSKLHHPKINQTELAFLSNELNTTMEEVSTWF